MKEMDATEKNLAGALLELAAEEFSNHGCNDLALPNDDEHWALAQAVAVASGIEERDRFPRPPPDKMIIVYDWMVMRYLANRLRGRV